MKCLYLVAALLFGCCIISVTSNGCGLSAPQITLQELDSGCSSNAESRTASCAKAMNLFCGRVTYSSETTTLGVSREHTDNRIGMSCVKSHWAGNTSIHTLANYHEYCNTVEKSQHRDCLSAIHGFCVKAFGHNYAGFSQGIVSSEILHVHCFRVTHKEDVRHDVLQALHPNCQFPDSHSDNCFAAASRWCNKYFASSGGITLEVNNQFMTVGCYNAEFSGDVFTSRVIDFYMAMSQANRLCDLEYDIPNGKIVGAVPYTLKKEVYDNTQSSMPLDSSIQISKEMKETCHFIYSSPWMFGAEYTFKWGIPNVAEGEIQYSLANMYSLSLSRENTVTKSYVQTSEVHVPPKIKIVIEAKVTKAYVLVPWTATIMNELGATKTIYGTWLGAITYGLEMDQRNI